ncbi:MAG: hypothetical protein NT105_11795 [Verrucomicrobia bacterium]|nr:hypothetical protein [Verrucomicrobiota bacterium]
MKRFLKLFAITYLIGLFLYSYFLSIPDVFPSDPAPQGFGSFLVSTGPAVGWVLVCTTYPTLFLLDILHPDRPDGSFFCVLLLGALPASAALWAWIIMLLGKRVSMRKAKGMRSE